MCERAYSLIYQKASDNRAGIIDSTNERKTIKRSRHSFKLFIFKQQRIRKGEEAIKSKEKSYEYAV